ncbi:MAG: undecaprenyl/decaprenyl-phosphate alpha-N-acetylglucosaminyl 1-phosphate transferase [Leptolyngbya sp. PLA3]|nr:MAG: undecaprenyl/decaprenyl-phosphate alpha-N-acetylglucosaminyl 1-phosphate transferase [Cyanobacteria bacterium CYA]MCE7969517.1 undecaprenyl/decaprenyl-phosphate alpha-N-acetylglucosaminyl 1-phosphate transferase [Leptolyngbya sp. PL-A3]
MISGTPLKVPQGVADRIGQLGDEIARLAEKQHELAGLAMGTAPEHSRFDILQGYLGVAIAAFLITLVATPLARRAAIHLGIIDRPSERKVHRVPIAYLGGVAVFLGIMGGIIYSYLAVPVDGLIDWHNTAYVMKETGRPYLVPPSIVLGITVIMVVGLIDDMVGIMPRVKLGGQLFAAAALAYDDIGVKVAQGVLAPTLGELINNRDLLWVIDLPIVGLPVELDLIYWTGTAIIAIFVLGGCNAANLIDGLDGLLTGVTAIAAMGLLVIALSLALFDDGPRDAQRIVLGLSVVGACLGFLPHNFNPASIFLGDCGSLMLGFCTIVLILMLGDSGQATGRTYLVIAGLIIYAIPIIDTVLAIFRRKLAGKRLSEPDSDHLHHMLKRALGVKGAVLTLYGIGVGFALLGIALSLGRARWIYALALLFASYIAVYSIKIARRKYLEEQAALRAAGVPASAPPSLPPGKTPEAPEPSRLTGTTP